MIVSLEEGLIVWLKIEQPEMVVGDKEVDQSIKVHDEIEQEFPKTLPNLS